MTRVEELCKQWEGYTEALWTKDELAVKLRAAIVADKAEAEKATLLPSKEPAMELPPSVCNHCYKHIEGRVLYDAYGRNYCQQCCTALMPHVLAGQSGMSRVELRQRAAIAAMQSLLTVEGNPDTVDELVVHSVRCADAIVAELEKTP